MEPSDPHWTALHPDPWPEWLTGFRSWQVDAWEEAVDHYQRGADVVVIDAPTGTGKTVIGEMVRRSMEGVATYICHSIRLQEQFAEDFPYARVVKGRSNYPTEHGSPWVTCADCEGKDCTWCDGFDTCPYRVAKKGALAGRLAIANTSYWLHEANHVPNGLRGRNGLVVDECDVLEGAVMGFAEVYVGEKAIAKAGVGGLKKGAHRPTAVGWFEEVGEGLKRWGLKQKPGRNNVKGQREKKAAMQLAVRCKEFAGELERDAEEGEGANWVREYPKGKGAGAVVYKPVRVSGMGEEKVWRWVGEKGLGVEGEGGVKPWVLAMSATVLSLDEWVSSNGLEGYRVEHVKVDSPFPVENRPVKYLPVGDMKFKSWERDVGKVVDSVAKILDRHPQDAMLIHATNYKVSRAIVAGIRGRDRMIVTHDDARGRDDALEKYVRAAREGRAPVIVSPSLDRGVDLPGDLCRVMVVAKMPFMSMGDRVVSERVRGAGGQSWYTANTARTLVQMTGRGVRGADDHAVTYVLDSQFGRWMRDGKKVLPAWWMDGVEAVNVRKFLSQQ